MFFDVANLGFRKKRDNLTRRLCVMELWGGHPYSAGYGDLADSALLDYFDAEDLAF